MDFSGFQQQMDLTDTMEIVLKYLKTIRMILLQYQLMIVLQLQRMQMDLSGLVFQGMLLQDTIQ